MELDLNKLHSFMRVVEMGSFTAAAKRLNVPKSRLSRHVSELEEDMGVTLIDRTTRAFKTTPAGRALYLKGLGPLNELIDIAETYLDEDVRFTGVIRIATHEDIGLLVLQPILEEFQNRHSQVTFDVLLTQDFNKLDTYELDFIVRIGRLPDSDLKMTHLGSVEMCLLASPKLVALHTMNMKDIKQVEEIPSISFLKCADKWAMTNDAKTETLRIKPIMRSNNPQLLMEYCIAGHGVALLPAFLCRRALEDGELIKLFPDWHTSGEPISLLATYVSGAPVHATFKTFLIERMKALFCYGFSRKRQ